MARSPSFQMFVGDFLSDPKVDILTPEELGGYIRLLLIAWLQEEPGKLPMDDRKLARWSRLGRRWGACRAAVLDCFEPPESGLIVQRRMVLERRKQIEWWEKSSIAGKKSAAAKLAKGAENGSTNLEPPSPNGSNQTPTKSQLFSLQSSSSVFIKEDPGIELSKQQHLLPPHPQPPKKQAEKSNSRPDQVELIEYFRTRWVEEMKPEDGGKPKTDKADWAQLGRLISSYGKDRTKALIDRYLEDRDPWLLKSGHALKLLSTRVDAYRANPGTPSRTGPAPRPKMLDYADLAKKLGGGQGEGF